MLELIVLAAMVVLMVKIADFEDESKLLWGFITFALCGGSLLVIPLPFFRIVIAGVVTFVIFMVYRIVAKRA